MISPDLEQTLNVAVKEATDRGHEYVTIEHVLLALLTNKQATQVIVACGGSIDELRKDIDNYFSSHMKPTRTQGAPAPQPTIGFQRVLQRAAQQRRDARRADRRAPFLNGRSAKGLARAVNDGLG